MSNRDALMCKLRRLDNDRRDVYSLPLSDEDRQKRIIDILDQQKVIWDQLKNIKR